MTVYCVGNAFIKRAEFRKNGKRADALCLDNDEMFVVPAGRNNAYFARGETPFGNFKVGEYITYHRTAIVGRDVKKKESEYYNRFFGFGLKLNKKMRTLFSSQYKMAQLLSRYTLNVRNVYIVFDGVEFTKKENAQFNSMVKNLSRFFNVFVSISDYRFIPQGACIRYYGMSGESKQIDLSSFVSTRKKRRVIKNALGNFYAKNVIEVQSA